jgi:hypothetical protein
MPAAATNSVQFGRLGGWIKFFLRGIFEVSQEATSTAWKIIDLREEQQQLIMDSLGRGAPKALILLERLLSPNRLRPMGRPRDDSQEAANHRNRMGAKQIWREASGRVRTKLTTDS